MKFSLLKKASAIVLVLVLIISIFPLGTLTASAATTGNTNTYFDRVVSYINNYGTTNSDGYKTILQRTTSGDYIYYYVLQNKGSGIYFDLLVSSNKSTYIGTNTEFVLYKNSDLISVDFMMLYYYSGSCADAVEATKSLNRSRYSPNVTYSLYNSGKYITSSNFSQNFNSTMELLCTYWDTKLYSSIGIGLEEIGFRNFPGKGSSVCDMVTGYHKGSSRVINRTESTCASYGYTGDTCCSACGEITSKGTIITTYASHKYSNDCDSSCNVCSEIRVIDGHKYSNACDAICNSCFEERIVGDHKYDNICDNTCDICETERTAPHSYTTSTVKATTLKNGSIVKKCKLCGLVGNETTIKYAKTFKLSTTSYTYNGKAKKPTVVVKDSSGKKLTKDKDYTISYASGRKKVGKYKVTIKLKGNYKGTKTLYFTINPASTKISKITAAKKSLEVKLKKVSSQATGYEIQYSTSKTFKSKYTKTKKVTSYKTTSVTLKNLKAKKLYYVRVRTYKTVDGKKYYSDWSSIKTKATSHTHSYSKATCTKAKTCKICNATSGKALGHTKDYATCTRCGKVLFKNLTYTGTGIDKISNINIPEGDYILKLVAKATNEDVIENCFVKLYDNNSRLKAHPSVTISAPFGKWTVDDEDTFEGPIKNGTIKIDTSDEVQWTITITAY